MQIPLGLQGHAVLYLVIAMLCLVIAMRFVKRALVPIGPLLQAVAAAAVVAFAVGAALVLLVASLMSGR